MKRAMQQVRLRYASEETQRHIWSSGVTYMSDGSCVIGEQMTMLENIEWLERMAMRIARTDELLLKVDQHNDREKCQLTNLGKELFRLMDGLEPGFYKACSEHVFNPFVTVMLRACKRWNGVLHGEEVGTPAFGIFPEVQAALEWIVRFVRRVCRSKRFKHTTDNIERGSLKNFQGGLAYMASLFAKTSRLLIVRVDLYYGTEGKGWSGTREADKSYKRFLRALREVRIVPGVCGWMSRREQGLIRGMHYHVLVAMNGHEYQGGFGYATEIGEYWKKKCTGPNQVGTYFNCYARQDDYKFNGLGLVHIHDEEKIIGVYEAVRYITKGYYLVRPTLDLKRNYCRGLTKAFRNRRGAPRKPENDMSIVMRVFGMS